MSHDADDPPADRNVFGDPLVPCSTDPTTGYLRDGHCRAVPGDRGRHQLCAVMTADFLEYSKARGNDLVTPRPEFDFPGLEPGDRWCVCVGRWVEAREGGVAPPVVLEATSEAVLDDVPLSTLRAHAHDGDDGDEGGGDGRGGDEGDDDEGDGDGRGGDDGGPA